MPSFNKGERAQWVFYMAHKFINDFGIRWLPVDPEAVIEQRPNWHLKYVDQLAYETGQTVEHILKHVMRSDDGLSMYDMKRDSYDIIINASDDIQELRRDALGDELYDQLEFEADLFAGEVLASKWLMRQLDIVNPEDISDICGLSDKAALSRYKKATEEYAYIPANVTFTLQQFQEYCREITVCATRDEIGELGRFAVENKPQPKFNKPMAPFLRKKGICPYCGKEHSETAKYCPYCGSALQKMLTKIPGVYCWNRQNADAAFCEQCGNPVLRIRQGYCFEECEI